MPHLVFAQSNDESFPAALAERHGSTHFALSVTTVPPKTSDEARVTTLTLTTGAVSGTYRVSVRRATADDVARARAAASLGKAAGMAELAARCGFVWLLEPVDGPPEWLTWECCALLALVALGPVLPDDGSTLLGVRSARERAARGRATLALG